MTSDAVENALAFQFDEQFSIDDAPSDIQENEFVERHENNSIICPEGGCSEKVNIADSDPPQFVCRKGHINPYDEAKHYYYAVDTSSAIRNLLDHLDIDTEVHRDGNIAIVEDDAATFVIVPGEYRDEVLQNLGQYLSQKRNICLLTFTDDCREGVKRFIDRFGGLSMVVQHRISRGKSRNSNR